MIVKFHPRGRGGGAGPVDYLLGKDRQREGATVLQGKPEEVRELIDASPYVKKYTSGVLSFAEAELPSGQREKLMASFKRVLMPGLDKDQYSILWVEHRDKGRLELNFLIPNTELLTGRRLQRITIARPKSTHRCLADHRERRTGAARPERAGEPAGTGHTVCTA
ncbi:relaxase/mobilization nuclease domain-containing protein [Enterobacter kobei]|uniref:relaxase/mobilization nuclease domain-containing protein n=1 Tax=Enterobacter kobei TaxID=208224 RepID=UPI002A74AA4E|nr:relaxase/mobilization nuclease domain-containing protein [Enterobacter kobei]MDY3581655.1 relaxase/mobilization nuclease domain-containing protein [Enterobacter kobei]